MIYHLDVVLYGLGFAFPFFAGGFVLGLLKEKR